LIGCLESRFSKHDLDNVTMSVDLAMANGIENGYRFANYNDHDLGHVHVRANANDDSVVCIV